MARFGSARFGRDTYGPPAYAGVAGGLVTVEVVYKLADRANHHRKDISGLIASGAIAVDLAQPSPMTFTGEASRVGGITPYRDWIAPILRLTRPDPAGGGDLIEEGQLGLYCVMPPSKTFTAAQGTEAIDGRDPLWLMQQERVADTYAVASGQNAAIAIRTLCSSVGLRSAIQASSVTLPKRRTWKAGTDKLTIANDLADRIGFLPLFPDRQGVIRSRRFRRLGSVEPARIISSAAGDVVETVTIEPDLTRLCNHVVVVGNDPKGDAVEAERLNDDPSSPTSTVALGVTHFRLEELTEETGQDAVDQMADRIMDQGSSVFLRTSVTTLPTVDWNLHDVVRLDIATDAGDVVAVGAHRWDAMGMTLGVDAAPTWTFNKLVNWRKVT